MKILAFMLDDEKIFEGTEVVKNFKT